MPLSEHEQRLLEQMERALYAEDPKFASALRGADLRAYFRRRALAAVAGFVVGAALVVVGVVMRLTPVIAAGGVVVAVCAWYAVSRWRRMPASGDLAARRRTRGRRSMAQRRASFMQRMEMRWERRRGGGGY